jgi:hypothetical protein
MNELPLRVEKAKGNSSVNIENIIEEHIPSIHFICRSIPEFPGRI